MTPLMIMAASQKSTCGSLGLAFCLNWLSGEFNSCNLWYFSCVHRAFLGRHSHHAQETAIKFSVRLRQHGLIIIKTCESYFYCQHLVWFKNWYGILNLGQPRNLIHFFFHWTTAGNTDAFETLMRLMRQPCHLRLRLLIGKVLNTGKIILAEWAKLCLDPIFIMQRIGLEKAWRVSICAMHWSDAPKKKHGECIPGLHMTLNASRRSGWLRVKPTYAVQGNMGLGWYQTSSTNGKRAYRCHLPQQVWRNPVEAKCTRKVHGDDARSLKQEK